MSVASAALLFCVLGKMTKQLECHIISPIEAIVERIGKGVLTVKKMLMVLTVIFCLLSSAYATEPTDFSDDNFDQARGLANFLEDHYGVTILIGDECKSVATDGFELGDRPSGRTPLLDMLGQVDYDAEIKRIDDCFAAYPGGFFGNFRCSEAEKGLRILLPNRITVEGSTMAGVTTVQDGYYNIFLGIGAYNSLNVHHEIWHAMEYRITLDYPDAFDGWTELNPDGFQYDDNYFQEDIWTYAEPKDDYFVRGYSVVNEMEDRATVIEAIFAEDTDWWAEHPLIQRKLDALLAAAKPVFGDVYFHE